MPDQDPPAHWHGFTAPRSPPPPGTNPRYDELEDHRRRYERLKKEAEQALSYHDARRLGLVANLEFYQTAEAKIIQSQHDLLSTP
jgi:hypothetical protein